MRRDASAKGRECEETRVQRDASAKRRVRRDASSKRRKCEKVASIVSTRLIAIGLVFYWDYGYGKDSG